MTELREQRCPRCGGYLKVIVVRKPIWSEMPATWVEASAPSAVSPVQFEEVEEVGDCFRCTGAY